MLKQGSPARREDILHTGRTEESPRPACCFPADFPAHKWDGMSYSVVTQTRTGKESAAMKKKVVGYLALILAITAVVLLLIALRGA